MESEKWDSRDFTENYRTTDLAILQSLASISRIVLRAISGDSNYSDNVYTPGQIACQFSKAHAEGQVCSCALRARVVLYKLGGLCQV